MTGVPQMVVLCCFTAICEPAHRPTILIKYDLRWVSYLYVIQCLVMLPIVTILRVLCHDAMMSLLDGLGYAGAERIVVTTVFRLISC